MQETAAGKKGKPARDQRNKVQEEETASLVQYPLTHLQGDRIVSDTDVPPSRELWHDTNCSTVS